MTRLFSDFTNPLFIFPPFRPQADCHIPPAVRMPIQLCTRPFVPPVRCLFDTSNVDAVLLSLLGMLIMRRTNDVFVGNTDHVAHE